MRRSTVLGAVVVVAGAVVDGAEPDAAGAEVVVPPAPSDPPSPMPATTPAITTVPIRAAAATIGAARAAPRSDRGIGGFTMGKRIRRSAPKLPPRSGIADRACPDRYSRSGTTGRTRFSSPRSCTISRRMVTMIRGELSVDAPRVRGK